MASNRALGEHFDLYRVLRSLGLPATGHRRGGSWSCFRDGAARVDKILEEMEKLDWDSEENLQLEWKGLKILVEEMPTIPTFGYPGVVAWDEYYWTNYPGAENPYTQPYHHWPNFKYMLPFLEPVER